MKNKTIQFVRGLMLLPFLTVGQPLAMFNTNFALPNQLIRGLAIDTNNTAQTEHASVSADHAKKIDDYFAKRDMPLEGYGAKLVKVADDNNLDWRLLPAIAVAESSGGRFACHNNPFGWGSCKIKFKDFDSAIETVALNLGGGNPATDEHYKDKTTKEKLYAYNGSVIPAYTGKVLTFMDLIEQGA